MMRIFHLTRRRDVQMNWFKKCFKKINKMRGMMMAPKIIMMRRPYRMRISRWKFSGACDPTRSSMKLRIHWRCSSLSNGSKRWWSLVQVLNRHLRRCSRNHPHLFKITRQMMTHSRSKHYSNSRFEFSQKRKRRRNQHPRKLDSLASFLAEIKRSNKIINKSQLSPNRPNLSDKSCSLTKIKTLMQLWQQRLLCHSARLIHLRVSSNLKILQQPIPSSNSNRYLRSKSTQRPKKSCFWSLRMNLLEKKKNESRKKELLQRLIMRKTGQRKFMMILFSIRAPSLRSIPIFTRSKSTKSQIFKIKFTSSRWRSTESTF